MTLFIYLLWNVIAFFLVGYDKRQAQRGGQRIQEKTFFYDALFLGALGVLLGLYFFRHKTRHRAFTWGIPLLLILNLAILYFFWKQGVI
ncbi:DUF1294 domain-containing protein [Heliorestis acidaminivorans]|uniref:DUF1294 domain-containing protein n=1 Tax=Heliorestis acidaminivorans TaxID=553427 RepID=A0A6I0EW49_9FIRM|nr:DUF1294 domain-containing protein [Heliorestis acidaminivorans]KAB2954644.1 DUF1294 domain-containing protein [Heliorestis acidaminivorans]